MKKYFFLLVLFFIGVSFADIKMNPNSNTYWEIKSLNQAKYQGKGVKIANDKDGFSLSNESTSPKSGHSIKRNVPISKEYPYLEFKTTAITPFRGYKNWSVSFRELQSVFGSITNAEPGVVVMNCFENLPKEFAKKQMTDEELKAILLRKFGR
jgi:hypothetical protein